MSQQAMLETRRQLEQTRKEVKDIRTLEAQMLWNMTRDEKKERITEQKAATDEIRDWRWKQADEMKAYVSELDHEVFVRELEESKEFQEFKRERLKELLDEEQKFIHEVYLNDVEYAAWRAELARAAFRREQALVAEKVQDVQLIRELKVERHQVEKANAEMERGLEQTLELQKLAKQMAEEKQKLMQSLEYTRSCHRGPVPLRRR